MYYFRSGEVAEWSNALVLKTSVGQPTGGSNPSFSAPKALHLVQGFFVLPGKSLSEGVFR